MIPPSLFLGQSSHMPGEDAVISALDAPVVSVALVAVLLAIIAVIVIVLFGGSAIRNILGSLRSQLKVYAEQVSVSAKQGEANSKLADELRQQGERFDKQNDIMERIVRDLEAQRTLQRDQAAATVAQVQAIQKHEEHTEQRYASLMEGLKGLTVAQAQQLDALKTNLVGEQERLLDGATEKITERFQAAVAPLLADLGSLRASIEETQARQFSEMERLAEKGANIQQQVLQALNKIVEEVREQAKAESVRPDAPAAAADDSGGPGHAVIVPEPAAV